MTDLDRYWESQWFIDKLHEELADLEDAALDVITRLLK